MASERRRVCFTGHVQGVGFRMTTSRLADGLPVTGFVRNLDDGRVELLVQGEPTALDSLVAAIQDQFGDSIRETSVVVEPIEIPSSGGFAIR